MVCVDAHMQYWDPTRGDYDWLTPDCGLLDRVFGPAEFAPLRARTGVAHTVVVQAAPTIEETRYLLGLARFEPSITGVVGWVSLQDQNTPDRVAELTCDPKFKGVRPRLPDSDDDRRIGDPALTRAIEALVDHDLVLDALTSAHQVSVIERLARRFPRLRIVVNHGAAPPIRDGHAGWQAWADGVARLARLPQVHCKLSGLANEATRDWSAGTLRPYVDRLLHVFGPDRLMWGSDWPRLNLNGDYIQWHSVAKSLLEELTESERSAVFATNAIAFYRLQKDR
ncbi:amidohydrolase family protein [Burkholderia cenocepacia]|uniref:amidohydrolase family protein n=1 Tax=Burkholderia cenocepacia TaxID=95486 RepID=UPI00075606AE|nr:amidohydrolase [Burkholderia cenocepacia]KWF67495.1 amidohydrolase [Burkholderia cenocepacia]